MLLVKACNKLDVSVGTLKLVKVAGKEFVVANVDGEFYAMDNWCTHEEGNLSEGTLKENVLTCPEHEAQFDVTTGRVLVGPDGDSSDSIQPEKAYKVKVEGNDLMIDIP